MSKVRRVVEDVYRGEVVLSMTVNCEQGVGRIKEFSRGLELIKCEAGIYSILGVFRYASGTKYTRVDGPIYGKHNAHKEFNDWLPYWFQKDPQHAQTRL